MKLKLKHILQNNIDTYIDDPRLEGRVQLQEDIYLDILEKDTLYIVESDKVLDLSSAEEMYGEYIISEFRVMVDDYQGAYLKVSVYEGED